MRDNPGIPHKLVKVENGVHNTFRCAQCDIAWSGLTQRDRWLMTTRGLGRCKPVEPNLGEQIRNILAS